MSGDRQAQFINLAERVERLAKQDEAVEREIATILFGPLYEGIARTVPTQIGTIFPRYTASLDAAMSLVPEGWQTLKVEQSHDGAEWIWRLYPAYRADLAVFGQTWDAPMALTAACLYAIAQNCND